MENEILLCSFAPLPPCGFYTGGVGLTFGGERVKLLDIHTYLGAFDTF